MPGLYGAISGEDSLSRLAEGDSPIHRLHPLAKLLATICFITLTVSFPSENVSGLMPYLIYPVVMAALSSVPPRPLLVRLLAALPFALFGGAANLFFMRETAFVAGGVAVSEGMVSFASIMLKTLLCVSAALVLTATTPFTEIGGQLSVLGVPKILCLQLVMTYRYLSALVSEAASMFTAYILRSGERRGVKMNDMGVFLGQLILRSADRAGRVYQSMKCRGFNGSFHSKRRDGFRFSDGLFLAVILIFITALRFFNLSVFLGRLAL